MERQLERRHEPEPVQIVRTSEENRERYETERRKLQTLPHVLKYDSVPWQVSAQAHRKPFAGPGMPRRLTQAPICTMELLEQILLPGEHSGKHRHYYEAIFYIIEGEGYEIHDDIKYPWEAGDVMCVPTYCVHQHFNPSADLTARLFFSIPLVFELMNLSHFEQMEWHPNYTIPPESSPLYSNNGEMEGYSFANGREVRFGRDADYQKFMEGKSYIQFTGEPQNTYQRYLKLLAMQAEHRRKAPHVMRGRDFSWENTEMGKLKYLITPYSQSPLLLFDCFLQELPPGCHSGRHRHVSEEVHKILQGKGYDIHNGKRWDWEKEDVVCIPPDTEHQHFNTDTYSPALFVSFQSRLHQYAGHGGIEHLEDASK